MAVPTIPSHRHRFSLPEEPGRREATWSLLMVAGTMAATIAAWIVGTFLAIVVFGLEEQQLLTDAGLWGYVAGLVVLALMAAPALVGIVLGMRARHHSERRLGTTGIVANGAIATYLIITTISNLLLG
jgi:hypothetical protein